MGCNVEMMQTVPTRWDYKQVPARCGQTSIYGTELRCEECSKKRPWYICKHGNDVSEYQCDSCETDDGIDPTPWCHGCGAMEQVDCDCLPIAENN